MRRHHWMSKALTLGAVVSLSSSTAFALGAERASRGDGPLQQASSCGCSGPSDCTCKKGKCKCKQCPHRHSHKRATPLTEPLRGNAKTPQTSDPKDTEARAGFFI